MIISCPNCLKKFEINSELIPDHGRKLLCGICNNEWFFKKTLNVEKVKPVIQNIKVSKSDELENISKKNDIFEKKINNNDPAFEIETSELTREIAPSEFLNNINSQNDYEQSIDNPKPKTNNRKFFNLLVFIITSIAFIILVDTFKKPISTYIPEIELILENLYESINDIFLFLKDLF